MVIATLATAGAYIAHLRLSEIPDLAIGHSPTPPALGRPHDKVVDYAVDGPAHASVTLSYLDANGDARDVTATLPWRTSVRTGKLTISSGVIAQSDADRLSCRIAIDGQVRDEQSATGPSAAASCKVVVS
ncbi:MmpS family transport accessory protein [Nocardia pseudobrasiliensis]|uniref:MmpS family membrane protein n=1 Tax=Nocardia pseudobrasiliensis TaxID=45979 RepID=A0A370IBE8_9NOCA|nr:MmpS family transport accessory protein [Nocardia pseudobrasiliensis]RDI68059.1 MmpS family membrane protein [Nocardia pseudobrasiliensis]